MRRLLLGLLLVLPALAGCLGGGVDVGVPPPGERVYAPLEGALFNTTGSWSQPITAPLFARLEPVVELVKSFDGTDIQVGIHRPNIPGCPAAEDAEYPPECRTPILLDSGPYYSAQSISQLSTRPPTAIWFVPQGYTVVYMAVRGTGGSGGCMEFMSMNEQKDVDAVITDVAQRGWSTGNVGMIGRSYDGTTPFMAAALGNPHLKTIVPISGVADVPELMFANGTSEFRGPIMHNVVYWFTYGLGMEPSSSASSQGCEEVAEGSLVGAYTAQTGDWDAAGMSDYWRVRQFRERILDHYHGSAFVIHGMQDWNVNPRMVVPWINELQDHGIKTKAWLGQWGHAYPDRADEHTNVRWDWAEVLLRWFDHELKGAEVDTGPVVEVEDHRHQWWVAESYPVRDLERKPLTLNADGTMTSGPGPRGQAVVASAPGADSVEELSLTSEPLEDPVRVSGLVQLPLKVTPSTSTGGVLYAQLYDVYPDGRSAWLGHAWMNLRYHEGGNEQQTLVPGEAVLARMQFEPLEGYLADGHRVRLTIRQDFPFAYTATGSGGNEDGLPHPEMGPVAIHFDGSSQLLLPLVRDFEKSPYHAYDL